MNREHEIAMTVRDLCRSAAYLRYYTEPQTVASDDVSDVRLVIEQLQEFVTKAERKPVLEAAE